MVGAVGIASPDLVAAGRQAPRVGPGFETGRYRARDNRCVRPIYITGHRNPDTDSIASAIGYAELKGRLDPNNDYVAARLGDLNSQTRWLMERSGAREPRYLAHVMLRAADVMQENFPVSRHDAPLREAGPGMGHGR